MNKSNKSGFTAKFNFNSKLWILNSGQQTRNVHYCYFHTFLIIHSLFYEWTFIVCEVHLYEKLYIMKKKKNYHVSFEFAALNIFYHGVRPQMFRINDNCFVVKLIYKLEILLNPEL